jgi:hypothetical protein
MQCSFSVLFNSTGFLTNMSEKHKSASPSALQVKERQKKINIKEKLHIILLREKDE